MIRFSICSKSNGAGDRGTVELVAKFIDIEPVQVARLIVFLHELLHQLCEQSLEDHLTWHKIIPDYLEQHVKQNSYRLVCDAPHDPEAAIAELVDRLSWVVAPLTVERVDKCE